MLDIVEATENSLVHSFATESGCLFGFDIDKLRHCSDLPPPLLPASRELALKYCTATASDHFLAAFRIDPTIVSTYATIWDHLQYLPCSPLDFDPQDPNLSIGLARRLERFDNSNPSNSVGLRGGGNFLSSLQSTTAEGAGEMETISSAPALSDFLRIEEYQEQTPSTFYSGNPVLHLHAPKSKVILQGHNAVSKLSALLGHESSSANGTQINGSQNGSSDNDQQESVEADVFVSSTALVLWASSKGVRIEYPSIGIHGVSTLSLDNVTRRALYMQLNLYDSENSNSEDDIETADVSIVPFPSEDTDAASLSDGHKTTSDLSSEDAVKALYDAVSDCQNLHPDSHEEDDEENGTRQPVLGIAGAPGDGGWITSENMAQFMDSNGNFIGFGAEADGDNDTPAVAGTRRPREDDEERFEDAEGDGETKWQRTG